MKLVFSTILAAAVTIASWAITPLEHQQSMSISEQIDTNDTPDDEANPYYLLIGEADTAIANEDYLTAIHRLNEAINISPANPTNALLYSNLGGVYSFMDLDSLALNAYNQALEIAPSMTIALENRGLLNLRMGREREAFYDFSKVIERDSLNTTARYYHGLMSLYAGNSHDAEADFAVMSQLRPDGYETWVALSSLYSMTGRDREAIPYFEKLISADPSPEYYAALAACHLALDQLSEVSMVLSEGLKTCGEDPELYYYRAWLNKESFLLDAAKSDAKRAIQLGADPNKVNKLFSTK